MNSQLLIVNYFMVLCCRTTFSYEWRATSYELTRNGTRMKLIKRMNAVFSFLTKGQKAKRRNLPITKYKVQAVLANEELNNERLRSWWAWNCETDEGFTQTELEWIFVVDIWFHASLKRLHFVNLKMYIRGWRYE